MTKYQTLGSLTEMYFRTVLESRSLNTECQQDLCSLQGPDGLIPCHFLAWVVPVSLEVLGLQPHHSKPYFCCTVFLLLLFISSSLCACLSLPLLFLSGPQSYCIRVYPNDLILTGSLLQ